MTLIPELALEIDRTVLSVGTRGGSRHRQQFVDLSSDVTEDAQRLLPRLAYFLLAGPIERSFVSERIPYTAVDVVAAALDAMVDSGHLVALGDHEVGVGEPLVAALEAVIDARREMATELWSEAEDAAIRAAEYALALRADVPEAALLATRHMAIDEPEDFWLKLYARLTTLRYVRADAHRLAWRSFGLDGPFMVQLTTAWHGSQPPDPAILEDGGWWDGELTAEGRQVRDDIEVRTNELNAEFLGGAADDAIAGLLDALGGLPGAPVERPL